MKKTLAIATTIGAIIAFAPAAHADNPPYDATCATFTITAPTGSRIIIGLDGEPPYGLSEGQSETYGFHGTPTTHTYTIDVHDVITDVQTAFISGEVTGCGSIGLAAEPESSVGDAQVPAVTEPAQVGLGLEAWVGVSLAPPW